MARQTVEEFDGRKVKCIFEKLQNLISDLCVAYRERKGVRERWRVSERWGERQREVWALPLNFTITLQLQICTAGAKFFLIFFLEKAKLISHQTWSATERRERPPGQLERIHHRRARGRRSVVCVCERELCQHPKVPVHLSILLQANQRSYFFLPPPLA